MCAIIAIYLLCTSKVKFLGFLCGGISKDVLVVGDCCILGGFHNFFVGISYWLNDSAYFKIEVQITLMYTIRELGYFLKPFILSLGGIAKLLLIYKKFIFKNF